MDGSTLQQTFDLVVLGTGHAESIVAAAAARAGKAVLHVDASGHYGGAHAALSLRQFEELAFPPTVDPSDATPARAPLGVAALLHARNDGLEFVGEPCRLPDSLRSVASRFTIDVVPSLILSVGRSVDAMRGSGAASYAEFKSLDSAWVIDAAPSPSADSDDGTAEPLWAFQKVPSSKADVFAAPFGLLEKRQLMKFLQFALEHAASGDGTAVTRLNEATLGAGRSLKRPQNKAPQALPVDDYADRPFVDFLGGPCGLSAAVQRQLLYGVALLPDPAEGAGDGSRLQVSTREGMARLSEYVLSLGRFGSTAFIASMYGHGEVAQALCRVGAVHGGIYVLRAPVCGVVLGDGCDSATPAAAADRGAGGAAAPPTEGAAGGDAGRVEVAGAVPLLPPPRPWRVGVTCTDGSCFRGAAVLAGAPYALAPLPPGSAGDSRADAAAFLVPPPPHDTTALGVCIAIAASPLLSLAKGPTGGSTGGGDGSAAPPETLMCATVPPLLPPVRYAHTVHVLQLGHANGAAPPGHYVLYCWTHATVRAGEGGGGEDAAAAAARAAACRAAAATMQAVIACGGGAAPLWQCTYSLATPVGAGLRLGAVPGAAEEGAPWVSLRPPAAASLHDEAVTAAAEDAWARLFPGLPLWSEGARRDADAPGEGATEAEADGAAPAAAASAPGAASSTAAAAPSADPAAGPGDDFDVFAALALLREDD